MGFGSEEYMDYTLLKKKGFLKIKDEQKMPLKSEGGFIDFTSFGSQPRNELEQAPKQEPAPSFGSFFDAPAQTSANPSPLANFDNPTTAVSQNSASLGDDFNALKIKVDDLDYKIDRFIERIDKIEQAINSIKLG